MIPDTTPRQDTTGYPDPALHYPTPTLPNTLHPKRLVSHKLRQISRKKVTSGGWADRR